MTYHERELLVSQAAPHQQSSSPRRTGNPSHHRWYSSRLSSSQSLRIECNAEERHLSSDPSSYTVNSALQPIQLTMTEQLKPVQFRSQIIVHNNPETDLFIERLRVAFYRPDELPTSTTSKYHRSSPPSRSQSLHIPKPALPYRRPQQYQDDREADFRRAHRAVPSLESQALLHQWIDDICANQQLMSNDDIVFFIKNGEFFARI